MQFALLFLLLISISESAVSGIFKCTGPSGTVSYSETPCSDTEIMVMQKDMSKLNKNTAATLGVSPSSDINFSLWQHKLHVLKTKSHMVAHLCDRKNILGDNVLVSAAAKFRTHHKADFAEIDNTFNSSNGMAYALNVHDDILSFERQLAAASISDRISQCTQLVDEMESTMSD